MSTFAIRTAERCCVLNITASLAGEIQRSEMKSALRPVTTAHTTVGLTVNEADSGLFRDTLPLVEHIVPTSGVLPLELDGPVPAGCGCN